MSRDCPRCQAALARRTTSGIEVDVCAHCGGVFLDASEFDALIAERFEGKKLESMFAIMGEEVDDAIGCSGCGTAMLRVDYDEIELDQCPDCGAIWIDGNERGEFARRAETARRSPEVDALVECAGCHRSAPQRLCIRRMDQFWCEECVIAGNHPGPEAQLVGTKDQLANMAASLAKAKTKQADARARNANIREIKRITTRRSPMGRDSAMIELAARWLNRLFDRS